MKLRTQTINVLGSIFDGDTFPAGSYPRKFVKDELVRVPFNRQKGSKGYGKPIVEGDLNTEVKDIVPTDKQKKGASIATPATQRVKSQRKKKQTQKYAPVVKQPTKKPKAPEPVYEVEGITGRRKRKGKLEYKVKWKGYADSKNTWEPVKNLSSAMKLVGAYEANR